ncbi:hypothetical protein [Nonomuraea sp. NPDC050310]|uniref:hypothetical protein n=1 Tax=Nonomuraea sp. NPDC050310 TaxID=3154935 RepID=UPI0033E136A6
MRAGQVVPRTRQPRRPAKYCCKACGNKASAERTAAPAVLATIQDSAAALGAAVNELAAVLAPVAAPLADVTDKLRQTEHAIEEHLHEAEQQRQAALAEAEHARQERLLALAERDQAVQERDAAVRTQTKAMAAQREAETKRDSTEKAWRDNRRERGEELGTLKAALDAQTKKVDDQAELLTLRAEAGEREKRLRTASIELGDLQARLRATEAELAAERSADRLLSDKAETATARLNDATSQIADLQTDLGGARAELQSLRQRLEIQARDHRADLDRRQEELTSARTGQSVAEAGTEHLRAQVADLQTRLASATTARADHRNES